MKKLLIIFLAFCVSMSSVFAGVCDWDTYLLKNTKTNEYRLIASSCPLGQQNNNFSNPISIIQKNIEQNPSNSRYILWNWKYIKTYDSSYNYKFFSQSDLTKREYSLLKNFAIFDNIIILFPIFLLWYLLFFGIVSLLLFRTKLKWQIWLTLLLMSCLFISILSKIVFGILNIFFNINTILGFSILISLILYWMIRYRLHIKTSLYRQWNKENFYYCIVNYFSLFLIPIFIMVLFNFLNNVWNPDNTSFIIIRLWIVLLYILLLINILLYQIFNIKMKYFYILESWLFLFIMILFSTN